MGSLSGASKKLLIGLFTVFLAAALAACGSSGSDDTASGSGGENTVAVGGVFESTGPAQPFGLPSNEGAALAVEQINEAGGVDVGGKKYTIDYIAEDSQSDPNIGIAKAQSLIKDDGVKYILGPVSGAVGNPVSEVTQQAGVLQMSAGSTLQEILNPDSVKSTDKYLFMTQASDPIREGIAAEGIKNEFGTPLTTQLLVANDQTGHFISELLAESYEEQGIEVSEPAFYPPETTDFSSQMAKLAQSKPDVLDLWYSPTAELIALRQAVQNEVASKGYGVALAAPSDIIKAVGASEPLPIVAIQSPIQSEYPTSPARKKFFADLEAANPDTPPSPAQGSAAWSYTSMYMLAKAWEEAGTVDDVDAVSEALANEKYDGILGEQFYDSAHIVSHGYDLCAIESGNTECQFYQP